MSRVVGFYILLMISRSVLGAAEIVERDVVMEDMIPDVVMENLEHYQPDVVMEDVEYHDAMDIER